MVEEGVDVVEDVRFGNWRLGDWRLGIALLELGQRPVDDVFAAIAAVFGVGVEREALDTYAGTR